ncbi:MAG: DUF2784 domain-containing protein [Hydrogenothermaceae bacterium]|nr:DUF2784 domain-containing protein [Hydrogenothermaceae bacterium]
MYHLLYELTVIIHFLWILFLIFGYLIGSRYSFVKYIHISGLVFAIFLEIFNLPCPLTLLENYFRKEAGLKTYEEGFISYYLEKIIYIEIEPFIIFILTIALIVVNIYLYSKKENR